MFQWRFCLSMTCSYKITQVATYLFSLRSHSTPLECDSLNAPFSIDIAPLWGEESAEKTLLKRSKLVSSNLG